MSKNFKKIGINLLIFLIQGSGFLIKFLLSGLNKIFTLIIRPFYFISKKLFGRVIIKLYGQFILLKSKLKTNRSHRTLNILTNNNTIHVTIITVTIIIFLVNVTVGSKKTLAAYETAPKPALFYLIQSEFAEDEELIVETFSQSPIITPEEEDYLQNLSSVKVQPQVEMRAVGETRQENSESIVQGGSAVAKPNIAKTNKIKRPRTSIVYHVVKPGETVSTISQEYDISVSTILWENNLNAYSVIRPGNKLAILPTSGISYTVKKGDTLQSITRKYDVEEEEITEFNKIANSSYLKIGQKLIIPGGAKKYTAPAQTSYSGLAALRNLVAPPSAAAVSGNKMNWPTVGHRITQYYHWRHHGLDIANKTGTPIYAADAGTVESAGWSGGYGNQVLINHGGGKKTRYGHASKLFVKKGDKVTKGQIIMAMGSTGYSTGPHLHFEVIINNKKLNPLDFIR